MTKINYKKIIAWMIIIGLSPIGGLAYCIIMGGMKTLIVFSILVGGILVIVSIVVAFIWALEQIF